MVYFDHNATTPIHSAVRLQLWEILDAPLNPSSIHRYGRQAKSYLEQARQQVKDLVNANNQYQLIFTSSGTEANNIAIRGLPQMPVLTSCIEHYSVLKPVGQGLIDVDANGVIRLDVLEAILQDWGKPALVSIMLANNETGAIQPIQEAAKIVHKYGGILHSDASQAAGKMPIDVNELDVDILTLSAHKMGGMQGAGALIFKTSLSLQPLMLGGGQEYRLRPGTHNIPAIYSFGLAAELAAQQLDQFAQIATLRDLLEDAIAQISPDSVFFSKKVARLANTSSFTMPGVNNETQVIHFDLHGISISAGAACSSGRVGLPYVQMSMGYPESVGRESIRVSLGLQSNREEVDAFINCWQKLYYHMECVA